MSHLEQSLVVYAIVALGLLVFFRILVWHFNKNADLQTRQLNFFRLRLIVFGLFVVGFGLALPPAPDFQMYEYPQGFTSLEEAYAYLKAQSKMLVRLTYIIYWFLFFFALAVLPLLYDFAKAITGRPVDSGVDKL